MSEPGDRRLQDEHRHETMKAIRRGDTAWALRYIAGPGAAIEYLRTTQGAGTTSEADATTRSEPGELRFPYKSVTTIDQLLANVSLTPTADVLRVTGIDRDGDAVVEALTEWVAGPPVVAGVLGLDSPPAVDSFYVGAALLAEIATIAATLRRTAELATDIERLANG